MDIDNLGPETLDVLIDRGLVRDVQDLYTFDPEELLDLPGFGEKKVRLIREGLETSKGQGYRNVLVSLGIPDVGQKAVELAARGEGGYMATILREPGPIYNVDYDKVPLEVVANSERTFPADWIAESGSDVTDDFVRYARPLVGDDMVSLPMIDGRQRMARFEPLFAGKKLPDYVPQADRK